MRPAGRDLRFWLPAAAFAATLAGTAMFAAEAAPPPVDQAYFQRDIKPILAARCLGCHGVDNRLGKLDLRSKASAMTGGTHGAALVPGNASKSFLFQLVNGNRTPLMPPGGKLPAGEIAKLRRWLDGGAPWADGAVENATKQVWWSFRAPKLPAVPVSKPGTWTKNPIDAFVLAKLREENLASNPPATRPVLIRRAYLDVIGIPPTPEEVDDFVRDKSANAWEKVVDRLLASPHYGERWGRHWLDLVRYADSSGFEGDKDRPNAWRYRDYVIRAFNDDKPYDQFIREQIAGDELIAAGDVKGSTDQRVNGAKDPASKPGSVDPLSPSPIDPISEKWVATGYLGHGQEDFAMVKLPTTRADELDDMVSTTSSVFLGLTVGCARCHDHKYDPVKQTDYYRLAALFAPTVRKDVDVPTPEEQRAADQRNGELEAEAAPLRQQISALQEVGRKAAMAGGNAKPNDEQTAAALPEMDRKRLKELQEAVKAIEAKRPQLPKAMTITDGGKTYEPFHLMIRGDAYQKGEVVQPGFITSLPRGSEVVAPDAATASTTGRRRALAEWLADPGNPLPSRVWMNRVWRQHFGRGIVDTTSNFGVNGELPSHPELLDWLALKFQSGGQRLKPMHRLMLLSNTYRQSSAVRPDAQQADPQNRRLWRMPVRRLEAEAVRDSILAVTGALNREMGGPPVYPPVDPSLRADTYQGINWPEGEDSPKTWRRSVYVKVKRSLILPSLEVFDCPEITASVAQRNVSVTPTQALLLLNDPLIHRQAEVFAARLKKEAGDAPKQQVDRAYRVAFGRLPTERERSLALTFLQKRSLPDFCHALLNLNELVYVP
jgi:cytochrome c553